MPTLDAFAGLLQGEHVVHQLYTRHSCLRNMGADAFMHAWDVSLTARSGRSRQLALLYPPQGLIGSTLMRLVSQPVHAKLILPDRVAPWTLVLLKLPLVAQYHIIPSLGTYKLSVGAPPGWTPDKPLCLLAWSLWPALQDCNTHEHLRPLSCLPGGA